MTVTAAVTEPLAGSAHARDADDSIMQARAMLLARSGDPLGFVIHPVARGGPSVSCGSGGSIKPAGVVSGPHQGPTPVGARTVVAVAATGDCPAHRSTAAALDATPGAGWTDM
ncbi:MAG TPA: hypothetical protein VHV75_03900 [Solirubrobacteraceae bacterium]|nr:hypothetical protein [Solirubrobacteraceae bacterium]